MRFTLILAVAIVLTPAAVTARPAVSGLTAAQTTDLSAARKKKAPKKVKEEYLKAAPGTGPSGPKN